ncbi:hypothetical protein MKK67_24420 [Methylobacterium sp. J-072]|uniref:hypothetical protein n=1 Tax=Methylobacterium sp. J-072 TaxID=2836651 RepID=UPI001FBBA87B|nr:hypothetical protein [Methylobacterium sp. J-072]MCJ2095618.1 hypothetical protein [Methylobacterium sp. J-072]
MSGGIKKHTSPLRDATGLSPADFSPSSGTSADGTDGGDGGNVNDMERRVATLEKNFEKLDVKIDKLTELVQGLVHKTTERLGAIEGRLTGIEKTLDAKAAKSDLGPLQEKLGDITGQFKNVPGIGSMITLVLATLAGSLGGAATLAYTLAKYLHP